MLLYAEPHPFFPLTSGRDPVYRLRHTAVFSVPQPHLPSAGGCRFSNKLKTAASRLAMAFSGVSLYVHTAFPGLARGGTKRVGPGKRPMGSTRQSARIGFGTLG